MRPLAALTAEVSTDAPNRVFDPLGEIDPAAGGAETAGGSGSPEGAVDIPTDDGGDRTSVWLFVAGGALLVVAVGGVLFSLWRQRARTG